MTDGALQGRRGLMIGYGLVLLMVLFLGIRAQRTVGAVLEPDLPEVAGQRPAAADRVSDELSPRDVRVAEALPSERDPFKDPPVKRAPQRTRPAVRTPAPAKPLFPMVQALIYNEHDSKVQIRLGDAVSDWLRPGDTYEGWKVERITTDAVRVARGDELHQLKVQKAY